MKAVILAGGFGTRISEESHLRPKPMIEIGGQPILWHIMKYYSTYGINEFVILGGYKQNKIKEYFANYFVYNSDITFNMKDNTMEVHKKNLDDWKVTILDTGLNTMTGGRIKRAEKYLKDDSFLLTYGDGLSDVNISELIKFHESHGKIATITTVSIAQQKGVLERKPNGEITSFREKSIDDAANINGGFMVLNKDIFSYLDNDQTVFEKEPLLKLASEGELMGYEHNGFWQCMDTQREKELLERLWANNEAPWKKWDN